jgi:hypothetical protein
MELIKTNCASCGRSLEFPIDFDSVVCGNCGAGYVVRDYKGTKGLSLKNQDAQELVDDESAWTLPELDEQMMVLAAEIENIRSAERAAPLQMGCAVFSLFTLSIVVIAIFMTVAAKYFGRWPFYLAMALVVLFALSRMRRRLVSADELQSLRSRREELERHLAVLESERNRVLESAE